MNKGCSQCFAAVSILFFGGADTLFAQATVANPADVATIEAIVRVSYEVISGPAGTPRQWRRDSTLYSPSATFVALSERDGKTVVRTMTPEDYRRANNDRFVADGLFETEVGSRIERFGNVAQVRSVSESRRTANGPIDGRYVNYFMLYWDGARWWISGMVWDQERPNNPIPKSWIGVREEVNVPAAVAAAQSRADCGARFIPDFAGHSISAGSCERRRHPLRVC